MSDLHDNNPAGAVREEDSFDVAAVTTWLREHADEPTGLDGEPEVRQFAGGASNLTFELRWPDRTLILRKPPRGRKAKSAHDMRREFTIQSQLAPAFSYVAPMVAFCDDESVIVPTYHASPFRRATVMYSPTFPCTNRVWSHVVGTPDRNSMPARLRYAAG